MASDALTVEVKGLEQLQRKFNMSNQVVKREAHDAMESSVAVVHDRAGTYPTAPPNSSYVRTGTLGRTFEHKVHVMARGVKGLVRNPTPYGPYVKGPTAQAWMHKGRWPTLKDDVEAEQSRITGFFEKAMQNLAKFLGD